MRKKLKPCIVEMRESYWAQLSDLEYQSELVIEFMLTGVTKESNHY